MKMPKLVIDVFALIRNTMQQSKTLISQSRENQLNYKTENSIKWRNLTKLGN